MELRETRRPLTLTEYILQLLGLPYPHEPGGPPRYGGEELPDEYYFPGIGKTIERERWENPPETPYTGFKKWLYELGREEED